MSEHSVHKGPPTWDGKVLNDLDLTEGYAASILGIPISSLIEGSDDHFIVLFTTKEGLQRHMANPLMQRVLQQSFGTTQYNIVKVSDVHGFCTAVWEGGARIMLDPEIVSAHHTRWKEVARDGDLLKYVAKPA